MRLEARLREDAVQLPSLDLEVNHEQEVNAAMALLNERLAGSDESQGLLGNLCQKLAKVRKHCSDLEGVISKLAKKVDEQMHSIGQKLPVLIFDIVDRRVDVSRMNAAVEESKEYLMRETQKLVASVEQRNKVAEAAMALQMAELRDDLCRQSTELDEKLRKLQHRQEEAESLNETLQASRSDLQDVLSDVQSRLRNLQKKESLGYCLQEDLVCRMDAVESRQYQLHEQTTISKEEHSRRLERVSSAVGQAASQSSDALRLLSAHVEELSQLDRKANAACAMARRSSSAGSSRSSYRASSVRRGRSAVRGDGQRSSSHQPSSLPIKISEVQARSLSRYLGPGYEHVNVTFR